MTKAPDPIAVDKKFDINSDIIGGFVFHNAEPILSQAEGNSEEKGWTWRVELIRSGPAKSPVDSLAQHAQYIMSPKALSGAKDLFNNSPCYVHLGRQHEYSMMSYSEMAKAGFYNNIKISKGTMTADLHLADNEPGRHVRSLLLLGWEKGNKEIIQFSAAYQGKHDVETEQKTDTDGYQYNVERRYVCTEITNVVSVDVVRKGNYETGALTMLQSLSEEENHMIIIERDGKYFNSEDQEVDKEGNLIGQSQTDPPTPPTDPPDLNVDDLVTQAQLQEFITRFDAVVDENKEMKDKIAAQGKLEGIRKLITHAHTKIGEVETFTDLEKKSCTDLVTLGINEGIFTDEETIEEKIKTHIDIAAERIEAEKKVEQTQITLDERDKEALALQAYAEGVPKIKSDKGIEVPAAESLSLYLQNSGADPFTNEGVDKIYKELTKFHKFCVHNFTEDEMIERQGEWMDVIPDLVAQSITAGNGWGATINTSLYRAMAMHPETQRYADWRKVVGSVKYAKAMGRNEYIVLGDYPRATTAKAEAAEWTNPTSPSSYTIDVDVKNYGYIERLSMEMMSRDMEGSLMQLIPRLYQAGELSFYTLVFALLRATGNISEDTSPLFSSSGANNHNNTKSEAANADPRTTSLNLENAKAAQSALIGQTPYGQVNDHDILAKDALGKYLIVPHDLYNTAEGIRALQGDGSTNDGYNVFVNQDMETIIDLTATDANDWYMQANPSRVPIFCAAAWKGISTPQIIPQTTATVGRQFTHDVTSYKMVFRFGVAIHNYRGIQRRQTT